MLAWARILLVIFGQGTLAEQLVERDRAQALKVEIASPTEEAVVSTAQHEEVSEQKLIKTEALLIESLPSGEGFRNYSRTQPVEVTSGGQVLKLEFTRRANAPKAPTAAMETLSSNVLQFPDETMATVQKKIHPVITPPPTASRQWWVFFWLVGFFGVLVGICSAIIILHCRPYLIQESTLAPSHWSLTPSGASLNLCEEPQWRRSTTGESTPLRSATPQLSAQGPEIISMASGDEKGDGKERDNSCVLSSVGPSSSGASDVGSLSEKMPDSRSPNNTNKRKSSISLRYDALDSLRQEHSNKPPSNSTGHSASPPESRAGD